MPRLLLFCQLCWLCDSCRGDIYDCNKNIHRIYNIAEKQSDSVLGCVLAVVTAGKHLIRGSEWIGIFSAISKQTRRFSLSLSLPPSKYSLYASYIIHETS